MADVHRSRIAAAALALATALAAPATAQTFAEHLSRGDESLARGALSDAQAA
jgi:hypothetical protein